MTTYNYQDRVSTTEGNGIITSTQLMNNKGLVYQVLLDTNEEKHFYVHEIEPLDSIVEQVREELLQRSRVGIKKYETTLDREDLSIEDFIQHSREEVLDLALYLTKIQKMLCKK